MLWQDPVDTTLENICPALEGTAVYSWISGRCHLFPTSTVDGDDGNKSGFWALVSVRKMFYIFVVGVSFIHSLTIDDVAAAVMSRAFV